MTPLKTDRVKALQKQSNDAIGIFYNTLRKLGDTNKTIRQEKTARLAKIKILEEENAVLQRLEDQNENLTTKINEFLGTNKSE